MRRLAVLLGLVAIGAPAVGGDSPFRFVDIAADVGLVASTWCGGVEKPHILESGGTGLAFVDYDGDGDLDLYLINGWRRDGPTVLERGANVLYRNDGQGRFVDATRQAGVGDAGWGTGVAVGDPNDDGLPDLFVSNFGPDVLYLNRGNGAFEISAGAPSIDGWSSGAAFFDADSDGDEDLYLAGYIDCTLEEVLHAVPELDWEGTKVMVGPFGLEGLGNRYFENLGGDRWRDGTEKAGLEDVGLFYTFGVAALDLDGDLDLDLYAANDSNPNYLYRNDGTGQFQEVGLWSGAALDAMGNAQAGMGLAAADLDGNGLIDLLVTNFYKDVSTLYLNLGDFIFEDVTRAQGLSQVTYRPLSWGSSFSDLDLDGDLDLFVVNGHIYPEADEVPSAETSYGQTNLVLENRGGTFIDASAASGPGLEVAKSSRGLAVGDVDGDGDLDLAVANVDAPATLLRNDSTSAGSWVLVDVPNALLVTVDTDSGRSSRHRIRGGSFLSASDPRLHFGLGKAERIHELLITWPDGSRNLVKDLPANRVLTFGKP